VMIVKQTFITHEDKEKLYKDCLSFKNKKREGHKPQSFTLRYYHEVSQYLA